MKNVLLTKEELNSLHGYASHALTLVSHVVFKEHILNDNSRVKDEVQAWTETSNKHLDNGNSVHLVLLTWNLKELINSINYVNDNEFQIRISVEQWKALKEIAYDISDIANRLMVKLRPHPTIDIITADIQPYTYNVCVYLHKNYISFCNNFLSLDQHFFSNK